jgi:hypothetical protein
MPHDPSYRPKARRRSDHANRNCFRFGWERCEERTLLSTFNVTNALDNGDNTNPLPGSLRAAVVAANAGTDPAGSVIGFDPSVFGSTPQTITLGGSELLLSSSNVTITGPGAALLAISGNGQSRVFEVAATVDASVSGLTVEDGAASAMNGGGILNGGVLTVSGCTISGNRAIQLVGSGPTGGGIDNNSGTLRIRDCILAGNSAYNGGGICSEIGNLSGSMSVTDCTFSGNSAVGGGGICTSGPLAGPLTPVVATVSGCTFSDNSVLDEGGAIGSGGGMTISGCNFSGNSSSSYRGGAIANGGILLVDGCTLSGNSAPYDGGGIVNYEILTVRNSTLLGNSAGFNGNGGAISSIQGSLNVEDCTLSGNSAGHNGGGINCGANGFGRPTTVTDCTLSDNSAFDGGGIYTATVMTVSGCNLSGNSSLDDGGGIYEMGDFSPSSLTVSGCIISGNSALYNGGGIRNIDGTLTIEGESATSVYGVQTFDISDFLSGNTAAAGADLYNTVYSPYSVGLTISHSAVGTLSDPTPVSTTINVAATDTATELTSSVYPSHPGKEVLSAQVVAAQAGAPVPSGTVTFYDSGNAALGPAQTLDASGRARLLVSLATNGPVYPVYTGDGSFSGAGSTSPPVVQAVVDAQTQDQLQNVVNSLASSSSGTGVQVVLDPNSFYSALAQPVSASYAQDVANAIAQVTAPAGVRVVITFDCPQANLGDLSLSTQPNVSLVVNFANGTTVVGNSPALVVSGGDVTIANATFTTATNAPTIQVSGGRLTLRDDVVQSSTGYSEPAIAVSGGSTLDLGTAASPGGNTVIVNGAGQVVQSAGVNVILAAGNNFQVNGATAFPCATVTLASSSNTSLLNQPVIFTATVSAPNSGSAAPTGNVTFVDATTGATLGVAPLSGGTAQLTAGISAVNTQTIAAVYSGDAHYVTSAATMEQQVDYHFGGFLAPLSSNLAFALGRSVPLKFQLTDYNGGSISSLSAIVSLQVLNSHGSNVLSNTGSTALRYDPSANQFVANWQTKGLPAGSYSVTLMLVDGTVQTKTVQVTAGGTGANAQAVDGTDTSGSGAAGTLLGGDISVFINDPNSLFSSDELSRILDAINTWDDLLAPYSVTISPVSDPTQADMVIDIGTSSACGDMANGVLGCFNAPNSEITMIQGWNWYAGADPAQIGSSQYDFETTMLHELGHALGLGGSTNPSSPMYETLASGVANRTVSTQDLNIPEPPSGADPQMAAGFRFGSAPPAFAAGGFAATPGSSISLVGLTPLAEAGARVSSQWSTVSGHWPAADSPADSPVGPEPTLVVQGLVHDSERERASIGPEAERVLNSALANLVTASDQSRGEDAAGTSGVRVLPGAGDVEDCTGPEPMRSHRIDPTEFVRPDELKPRKRPVERGLIQMDSISDALLDELAAAAVGLAGRLAVPVDPVARPAAPLEPGAGLMKLAATLIVAGSWGHRGRFRGVTSRPAGTPLYRKDPE